VRSAGICSWEDAYSVIEPQITAESIHLWPFDPNCPIDVRYLVFGTQGDIRLNRHDYFEIMIIESGRVGYQVQDRVVEVQTGDLFLVGSTLLHKMKKYEGTVRAGVLYFLPSLISGPSEGGKDMEYLRPFLVQDRSFPHVVAASTGVPSQVAEWMYRIRLELPAESSLQQLAVRTYLKLILLLLARHFSGYSGAESVFLKRQKDLDRLKPVFNHLDGHYGEPISLAIAARLSGMSRPHFMRFFRQVTGQSFVTYLLHFRVAKAQQLMLATDRSLAEISQECGFCDQSYFGLVFRRLTAVTPREFRKRAAR